MQGRHPGMQPVIQDATPRELADGLRSGRYDLILAQLPVPEQDVQVVPLYREPLRLAVPAGA